MHVNEEEGVDGEKKFVYLFLGGKNNHLRKAKNNGEIKELVEKENSYEILFYRYEKSFPA